MTGWTLAVAGGLAVAAAAGVTLAWVDHRELQQTAARWPEGRRWP